MSLAGFEAEFEAQSHQNISDNPQIMFCGRDIENCANDADALLLMTEWDCFKTYDY